MTVTEVLQEVRKTFAGSSWCKGNFARYSQEKHKICYCTVGMIRKVVFGNVLIIGMPGLDGFQRNELYTASLSAVAVALEYEPSTRYGLKPMLESVIIDWNDSPGTKLQDVLEVLDTAIEATS